MKKLLLIVVLLFTSNILFAGQIKLSCDINLTITYSSGNEENKKIREVYEIDESPIGTTIIPISNTGFSPSVSTYRTSNSVNNSDENKWDIKNNHTIQGNSHITSVTIDRNSGQIFTSHEMIKKDNKVTTFIGIGSCEKVDTSKKKF
jgi:hypothetical protein